MDLMNSYFLDNTKFVANMHNTTILNLNRSKSPNKGDLFWYILKDYNGVIFNFIRKLKIQKRIVQLTMVK